MNQIQRICAMEEKLERCVAALAVLESALDGYQSVSRDIQALAEYMDGGQWLRDYTDDAFGRIPRDLKRGVLSQDALYDMLTDDCRLKQTMLELCKPEE